MTDKTIEYNDTSRALEWLSQHNLLPNYVTTETSNVKTASNAVFADKVNGIYPITNKKDTFVSAIEAACAGSLDKQVYNNIKQASVFFNIEHDVVAACKALANVYKTTVDSQIPTQKFALSIRQSGSDDITACLPINTIDEIESSAIALENYKCNIALPLYYEGCRNIKLAFDNNVSQADKRYVFLPESVLKDGVEYLIDKDALNNELEARKHLSDKYACLQNNLNLVTENDDIYRRIRDDVYNVDVEYGIDKKYATSEFNHLYEATNSSIPLQNAIDMYNSTVKVASVRLPLELFSNENFLSDVKNVLSTENGNNILNAIKTASCTADIETAIFENCSRDDCNTILNIVVQKY